MGVSACADRLIGRAKTRRADGVTHGFDAARAGFEPFRCMWHLEGGSRFTAILGHALGGSCPWLRLKTDADRQTSQLTPSARRVFRPTGHGIL